MNVFILFCSAACIWRGLIKVCEKAGIENMKIVGNEKKLRNSFRLEIMFFSGWVPRRFKISPLKRSIVLNLT